MLSANASTSENRLSCPNETISALLFGGNGYSVLLAVCSAICPASFGYVLSFCMGQNILVNEWTFYAIHL
jgi:hypothetical protein